MGEPSGDSLGGVEGASDDSGALEAEPLMVDGSCLLLPLSTSSIAGTEAEGVNCDPPLVRAAAGDETAAEAVAEEAAAEEAAALVESVVAATQAFCDALSPVTTPSGTDKI